MVRRSRKGRSLSPCVRTGARKQKGANHLGQLTAGQRLQAGGHREGGGVLDPVQHVQGLLQTPRQSSRPRTGWIHAWIRAGSRFPGCCRLRRLDDASLRGPSLTRKAPTVVSGTERPESGISKNLTSSARLSSAAVGAMVPHWMSTYVSFCSRLVTTCAKGERGGDRDDS